MARQPWERPWDTPGLPFRNDEERCANHSHCEYRDDDPTRCPWCHVTLQHLMSRGHAECLSHQRQRSKHNKRKKDAHG